MKAGILPPNEKLTIYRASAGSWDLAFTESETGDPLDLSGKTFIAQVRDRDGSPVLLDINVTATDLPSGLITLSWTAADTAALPIRRSRWGLLDSDDILWIEDVCELLGKTPA